MDVPLVQDQVAEERLRNMKRALIIFQKNAVLGKVKTRLAATIGDENAMTIYKVLVGHTHQIVSSVKADKYLYFSDQIESNELWNQLELRVQLPLDLGARMHSAITELLSEGYEQVVVIGTDCYALTPKIVSQAFEGLNSAEYVIGPALDGGYYLIGCTRADESVFLNKEWSTETVFKEAQESIDTLGVRLHILQPLSDVDEEKDLGTLHAFIS